MLLTNIIMTNILSSRTTRAGDVTHYPGMTRTMTNTHNTKTNTNTTRAGDKYAPDKYYLDKYSLVEDNEGGQVMSHTIQG